MPVNPFEDEVFLSSIDSNVLKRIFSFARPHRKWIFFFLIIILVTTVTDAAMVYINKLMIDQAVIPGDLGKVVKFLELYGVIVVFQAFSVFGFIYLAGLLSEKISFDLRQKMFDHLQTLSLSYYTVTPVGWIMSRVNSDSVRISDLISWGVIDSAFSTFNILIATFFMVIINWKLALVVVFFFPIMVYIGWQFRKRILREYREVRRLNSKVTGAFNENISGVKVVKSFQREERNLKEFNRLSQPMFRSACRAARWNALFLPSIQLISSIILAVIVWSSDWQVSGGLMTIGGIQAFVNYVMSMMWPVQDLARVYGELQQSIASGERIFSLLDTAPSIHNRDDACKPEHLCGDIEFDHVSFFYDDGDGRNVLTDFSLKVKQGEMIALVGSTGGGKSTIVNLMARFYEPKSGEIRICGRDYREYTMESIQSSIGMVLQTPYLFSGTIRENLRYGRLDATNEEIEQAAVQVGADEFIRKFPNQYEEQVGEGGSLLSVGQKQLISLGRAVLADPEIFIMDEATSSVDTLTEHLIQAGMERMLEGRTSFVIAHRLSTIRRADRILVIEDGKIAEEGTHKELLKLRGKYYHLYTSQFREQKELDYAGELE